MSRADEEHNAHRCPRCTLPTRWCICEAQQPLTSELAIDVLIHEREMERPTSTGHLIQRVFPATRHFVWKGRQPVDPAQVRLPGRELWILHPNGEEMPEPPPPSQVQVLLVDGSWKQSTAMMKTLHKLEGRRVRLPVAQLGGGTRFWLRNQQAEGYFSTAEALLHLMQLLGMHDTQAAFRLQFELHVYAVLCARGAKLGAAEYLSESPIAAAFPELVARLNHCRKDYYY